MPYLRTAKGIATADYEALLVEPTFVDLDDSQTSGATNTEGDNIRTDLVTLAGDGRTRWNSTYTYSLLTHLEQFEFFKHQEHLHGASRPVWLPSWRSDFLALTDIVPSSGGRLRVAVNGFEFVYENDRYGLMIESVGGALDIYRLIGYDQTLGDLIIADDFDVEIPLSEIMRISLVRRVRSTSDVSDWEYLSESVAQVGMSFIEVFEEGAFL